MTPSPLFVRNLDLAPGSLADRVRDANPGFPPALLVGLAMADASGLDQVRQSGPFFVNITSQVDTVFTRSDGEPGQVVVSLPADAFLSVS